MPCLMFTFFVLSIKQHIFCCVIFRISDLGQAIKVAFVNCIFGGWGPLPPFCLLRYVTYMIQYAGSSLPSFFHPVKTKQRESLGMRLTCQAYCEVEHRQEFKSSSLINSYLVVSSFPGLPHFCSSVCVQYNAWKWKSGEKWGRPGNTYHVDDVRSTRGGRKGGGVHIQVTY